MTKRLAILVGTLIVAGCSHPCRDYCEDFIKRTQDCGLGGPSGDSAVDECNDEVSKYLTDDACTTGDDNVKNMSCDQFTDLVCSQSNASSTYKCPQ